MESEGSLYRVHKSTWLDSILTQPNPVRPINLELPKVHLNVILQLPGICPFEPPNQNPVNIIYWNWNDTNCK
jgi:hypothetical protein